MQPQETDLMLITSVLNGDKSAYGQLVNRHQRYVFTLALRFTKNREDAEEVAQDCFVKAYRALGTFKQSAKFSTWLYTITYTSAMTMLRKKRLLTNSLYDDDFLLDIPDTTNESRGNPTENKSAHSYLNLAINSLNADDATIITLFYQGEQSLEEIGKVMHTDPKTIKVKLHRARLKLKEKLQYLLKDEVKELI